MNLFDWLSFLGQSASEISFAQSVYQTMLQYHLGLIKSEAEKEAKAKAQLAETGRTKMIWDDDVAKKDYVWSIDVLYNELKTSRVMMIAAMNYLECNGYVKRLVLPSGQTSQCYFIPIEKVLQHG